MVRRLAVVLALLGTLATSLVPSGGLAQSGDAEWNGSIIAEGGWRVEVVAAAQGASISDAGLDRLPDGEWLLVVADVTNWTGDSGSLPLDDLSLGTTGGDAAGATGTVLTDLNLREGPALDALILTGMPAGATVDVTGEAENGFYPVTFNGLEGYASVDGISVEGDVAPAGGGLDSDGSGQAAAALGIGDGGADIETDATARVALAFQLPAGSEDPIFTFGTALPLTDALAAEVDLNDLGDIREPQLVDVTVDEVDADGTLTLDDDTTVALLGAETPERGACFSGEAIDELEGLVDGTVTLERATGTGDDPVTALVWREEDGERTLINHELIAVGLADSSFDGQDDQRLAAWFDATRQRAEDDETGLWGECTGFNGDQRQEPTVAPTPAPNAAEVRADYLSVDPGALPGSYFLKEISFTGVVVFVVPLSPARAAGDLGSVRVGSVIEIISTAYDGSPTIAIVGFNGDTTGIVEGASVTIYGTGSGTFTGPNGNGEIIVLPYVIADIIDIA